MAFWTTVMDSSRIRDASSVGRRLVPVMVDQIAKEDPRRKIFSFPKSEDLKDGFQDLDFSTFANAVNKTAFFIQREIGRSSMFETVLYMGDPDVRHFIALVALMKTGHKVLFSSHHNSIAGHVDLIRRTDCAILLHTAGFSISHIAEKCRMETICMPELDYLLDDSQSCEHYPYNFTFEEAKNHPCVVVHTSGSTGMPKPVVWTHQALVHSDVHHKVPQFEGRPTIYGGVSDQGSRTFSALPMSHGAGLLGGMVLSLFNKTTVVLGPPGPVTADTVSDIIEYGHIDSMKCVPVTLEDVAQRPDVLAKLKDLYHIIYVGGQLSKRAGDTITNYTHLYCSMASTETTTIIQHATDPNDWNYMMFNPDYNGIEMRPLGHLYELVFVRRPEIEEFQGIFKTFPKKKEYSMSDLYSKHPTKPHHWKYEGRKDGMIIFKNGWNFNPLIHEQLIMAHTAVENCVLVGTGRDKPAAIIKLSKEYYTEDREALEDLLDDIWENVEQANELADTAGQLEQEYVIWARNDKPFLIAGKGTVQRKATIELYEHEVDELYRIRG
ncbi:acetyl-CoA synthetase-like protein [Aaosphaeria arxii CBS 175.79]|uniref:Acetyl-CoA synthetase-like protein n=1 Tax=Aaosphaeria arxii CBS 175.79 TaxID=1450172 RepID=A0A6A5XPF4_9PLEO|nr:acetyl-CoA synthetase-like protein [Aaosphaeria arxii CBS 175.79]KAF2015128.1 acetyl-CoA synthetase-like protein [Aaosphaeria arxii CBS 175.79]